MSDYLNEIQQSVHRYNWSTSSKSAPIITIEQGDPKSIAIQAYQLLTSHTHTLSRIKQIAQKFVINSFSLNQHVNKYKEIYEG